MANRNKKRKPRFTEEELEKKPWRSKMSEADRAKYTEQEYQEEIRHQHKMEENYQEHRYRNDERIKKIPGDIFAKVTANMICQELIPKVVPELAKITTLLK